MAWSSFSLLYCPLIYYEVESHYQNSWKHTITLIFHSLPYTFLMLFPEYCSNIVYCHLNTQRITLSMLNMLQTQACGALGKHRCTACKWGWGSSAQERAVPKPLSILCKLTQARMKCPVLISFTHPSSVCLNCIKLLLEESFILMNFWYMHGYSRKTTQ